MDVPPPPVAPRSSLVMARLTLSVIERGSDDPGFWRRTEVHRALLVSGLSVLVGLVSLLQHGESASEDLD
ncbi:MAG: hypothetical protein VKI83_10410 [Synechococcaceae cyanobacterium]|nr:hypothetical protein [Synechococcaceae cyanobacterium]